METQVGNRASRVGDFVRVNVRCWPSITPAANKDSARVGMLRQMHPRSHDPGSPPRPRAPANWTHSRKSPGSQTPARQDHAALCHTASSQFPRTLEGLISPGCPLSCKREGEGREASVVLNAGGACHLWCQSPAGASTRACPLLHTHTHTHTRARAPMPRAQQPGDTAACAALTFSC